MDLSEKSFEEDIESSLLKDGYRKILPSQFNQKTMFFDDILIDFIKDSQPKAYSKIERNYGEYTKETLLRRINECIDKFGLLYCLKNGVNDGSNKFKLCFFKPDSSLNQSLEDLYSKNIIGVTRQFRYTLNNTNTIDMVLSINGIPIIAFELKDQFKGQSYIDAIRQYKEDRNKSERIFSFDTRFFAYFAIDTTQVYLTTKLNDSETEFIPFNQGSNGAGKDGGRGNPRNKDGYDTSYLWENVFEKDSFLNIINKFLTRVSKSKTYYDNGVKKQIKYDEILFPRFHQFDVVNKVIEDVKKNNVGHNYLIQHSTGSGKSNSIAWLTYRLASLFDDEQNPIFSSVIVLTNRIVLDNQLQETIESFDHKPGLVASITKGRDRDNDVEGGSKGLLKALNDKRKIIISTIQKFKFILKELDDTKGRNYAIIVDESHQGQSGESAKSLRRTLIDVEKEKQILNEEDDEITDVDFIEDLIGQGKHDNQSFFAFTATPKSKTLELFGTRINQGENKPLYVPFHIYSMRQAIEEGFILDVLQNYTTIDKSFKIVKIKADDPELDEIKTKKALFRYYSENSLTINKKVEIIMEHFLDNGRKLIDGNGKAMIVADSRINAVNYFNAIKEYISKNPTETSGCHPLVAFSPFTKDGIEYKESNYNILTDGSHITSDKKLREEMSSPDFNILVVANKYQMGYDEPLLNSMYVDKKLQGVNAIQCLSRINRIAKNKDRTFVLDFANEASDIQSAFQRFYKECSLQGDTSTNDVYDKWRFVKNYGIFDDDEVDQFNKIMNANKNKTKQSDKEIGKLQSTLTPAIERYMDIEDLEKRLQCRDSIMKFTRSYSFVTQLFRLNDQQLFKDYQFLNALLHFLPSIDENVNIENKVRLEYVKLKKTFEGSISLNTESRPMKPSDDSFTKKRIKKDTLSRIIDKINAKYSADQGTNNSILPDIYNMMHDDPEIIKIFDKFAKDNDINAFITSIFPEQFKKIINKCYVINAQRNNAYDKLLTDSKYQKDVQDIIAEELYKSLKYDQ